MTIKAATLSTVRRKEVICLNVSPPIVPVVLGFTQLDRIEIDCDKVYILPPATIHEIVPAI